MKRLVARKSTAPVFVLTHYAREAANGRDIRLGSGVDTVRDCLCAALIGEAHLAPILLGS